jgi:hypothetical protein
LVGLVYKAVSSMNLETWVLVHCWCTWVAWSLVSTKSPVFKVKLLTILYDICSMHNKPFLCKKHRNESSINEVHNLLGNFDRKEFVLFSFCQWVHQSSLDPSCNKLPHKIEKNVCGLGR